MTPYLHAPNPAALDAIRAPFDRAAANPDQLTRRSAAAAAVRSRDAARNAPLVVEGRHRLIERCRTRPIAHVAAEMGISRACASKRVNRWRRHGDPGLLDRPSAPHHSPRATPAWVMIEKSESWGRHEKWSAQRITHELAAPGYTVDRRTVTRHLTKLGLGHRRFLDPCGDSDREPGKISAR